MLNNYKLLKLVIFILVIISRSVSADIVDAEGVRWPIPDWAHSIITVEKMHSPECSNFEKFSMENKSFLTEGLVVIKDGKIKFEKYEKNYNVDRPHVLWSISKTITGALLGISVKDQKILLDQKLYEFYPRVDASENYQKITVENLFYLDSGFIWDEYYSGDVRKSPVLNMLYGSGHKDIVEYATSKNIISDGPGFKFNYSTGSPAITMGILKQVYGDEYEDMPWKNLFNKLNMNNVYYERDSKGVFNGGSSVFATPRDMAKLGYLYLNKGHWNGEVVLDDYWFEKTIQVSPGYLSDGTIIRDITDDGVYGGSIWLNKSVKPGFGRPYPVSPSDMFLAMGHFGQLVIVLPSQKMVIARTGYDQEYNSKIDEFVTRAIACFDDPNYPIGKNIPPPSYSKTSITAIFSTLKSGLQTNVMQAAVGKTVCSCHFISGLDKDTCIARSNIPLAKQLTEVKIINNQVFAEQSKFAKLMSKILGFKNEGPTISTFDVGHPQFGCTLN